MIDLTIVKRVGFLSALSESELQALLGGARQVPFKKDEVVLTQSQSNASLFVVQEGLLHARRLSGGRELFLGRLEQGSFFGELSLFDPGPTTATVQGVIDGTLLEISRPCFDQFLSRHPAAGVDVLLRILKDVASRLRRTDERLSDSVVWGGVLRSRS